VDAAEALDRAEALCARVSGAPFRWQPLTASAGVATFRPAMASVDTLVRLADEALYRAKEEGRDRVVAAASEAGEPEAPAVLTGPDPEPDDPPGRTAARTARIVIVDDERVNLRAFGRALNRLGFAHVEGFSDPVEGLEAILDDPPDLVLLDICMDPLDGFDVLERLAPLRHREGYLPVLILTGERSPEIRQRALRAGGKDFLHKPVDLTELEARILNLLETGALHRQLRDARDRMEERVLARTRELEDARVEILGRLALAAEYRDDATGRHQERVGILSALLAARMGLDGDMVSVLRLAAPLHDLGKIAIPDHILHKPGPLTAEEYARMRGHTVKGAELLAGSPHRVLEVARVVALSHHERWDGQGYPAGLSGEAIPLVGRIVSVADVFDSLTHRRAYKEAYAVDDTMAHIRGDRGTAFDPRVVDALEELHEMGQLDSLAREDPVALVAS
jgi:putative two-component system response regulator